MVEWIKLNLNILDGDLFSYSHEQQFLWIKMLILAGKEYKDGVFTKSNGKPIEQNILLKKLDCSKKVFDSALERFIEDMMVSIDEQGRIVINNWFKYQDIEAYERKKQAAENKKERDREYQRKRYYQKKEELTEIKEDPEIQEVLKQIKVCTPSH